SPMDAPVQVKIRGAVFDLPLLVVKNGGTPSPPARRARVPPLTHECRVPAAARGIVGTGGQLVAARSESSRGFWSWPIDTASRLNRKANVQSTTIRSLRLNVGILLTWYVRCMNQATKPLALKP